jgi:hypothetical protein
VWSERVAVGQEWMLEVVGCLVGHTKTLHYSPGAFVGEGREGNDLVEAQVVEAERDGGAGAF